jgi:hypothetical protein
VRNVRLARLGRSAPLLLQYQLRLHPFDSGLWTPNGCDSVLGLFDEGPVTVFRGKRLADGVESLIGAFYLAGAAQEAARDASTAAAAKAAAAGAAAASGGGGAGAGATSEVYGVQAPSVPAMLDAAAWVWHRVSQPGLEAAAALGEVLGVLPVGALELSRRNPMQPGAPLSRLAGSAAAGAGGGQHAAGSTTGATSTNGATSTSDGVRGAALSGGSQAAGAADPVAQKLCVKMGQLLGGPFPYTFRCACVCVWHIVVVCAVVCAGTDACGCKRRAQHCPPSPCPRHDTTPTARRRQGPRTAAPGAHARVCAGRAQLPAPGVPRGRANRPCGQPAAHGLRPRNSVSGWAHCCWRWRWRWR